MQHACTNIKYLVNWHVKNSKTKGVYCKLNESFFTLIFYSYLATCRVQFSQSFCNCYWPFSHFRHYLKFLHHLTGPDYKQVIHNFLGLLYMIVSSVMLNICNFLTAELWCKPINDRSLMPGYQIHGLMQACLNFKVIY
jgi:hypothetical protein